MTAKHTKQSLQGLEGVYIVVEEIYGKSVQSEILEQQIKEDIKLKILNAEIPVLSTAEWMTAPGAPFLYIHVNITELPDSSVSSFSLSVELNQNVIIARKLSINMTSSTWKTGMVSIIEGQDLANCIRSSVDELVDLFIIDYLEVN